MQGWRRSGGGRIGGRRRRVLGAPRSAVGSKKQGRSAPGRGAPRRRSSRRGAGRSGGAGVTGSQSPGAAGAPRCSAAVGSVQSAACKPGTSASARGNQTRSAAPAKATVWLVATPSSTCGRAAAGGSERALKRTLRATRYWLCFSRARYTFPNLPRPSGLPTSKSASVQRLSGHGGGAGVGAGAKAAAGGWVGRVACHPSASPRPLAANGAPVPSWRLLGRRGARATPPGLCRRRAGALGFSCRCKGDVPIHAVRGRPLRRAARRHTSRVAGRAQRRGTHHGARCDTGSATESTHG